MIARWVGAGRLADPFSDCLVARSEVLEAIRECPDLTDHQHDPTGSSLGLVAASRALGFTVAEYELSTPRRDRCPSPTRRERRELRRRLRNVRVRMRHDQTAWSARGAGARHQHAADDEFGAADELVTLAGNRRFTNWIVEQFDQVIGARVLEVGAGLGAVTRCIAERHPDVSLTALEPAPNLLSPLRRELADVAVVTVLPLTSQAWHLSHPDRRYDTVVYVNVLEHIRDDVGELVTARTLLEPSGHVCIFVPALPRLYGPIDRRSGHYRRYTRRRLAEVIDAAGFDLVSLHHLDLLGVIPYWFLYRLIGARTVGSTTSGLYDRVVVPVGRALERRPPPIGKNLVAIARPRPDHEGNTPCH